MNNTINTRIEEALADEMFLSKFQAVTSKEEILNLFSTEKGIDLNEDIARELLQGIEELKNNGELTEAELENAAGGMCVLFTPLRSVFTKIFSTHIDFAGNFNFNMINRQETRRF